MTKRDVVGEENLDDVLNKVDLSEKTEMGEVTKEFSENKPSSSNLTHDEHRLTWRARSILKRLSPRSADIINDFVDSKRSVDGWNTNRKVEAITGIQQQRQGMMGRVVDKMFGSRGPQQ